MRAAAALLAGLLLASAAAAETVQLNDGSVLKGRIVKADAGTVTLETPDGLLELHKERIKSIDYAPEAAAPAAAAPAPAPMPEPAPAPRSRRLRLYGSLELMTAGNADRGLRENILNGGRQLNPGAYSGVANFDTSGALAVRVGLRGEMTERSDLGFSVGFIGGPNTDVTANVANGAGQSALLTDKRELGFVRFLAEPSVYYPLSGNAALHLGAGLGVAHGNVTEKYTCSGTACAPGASIRESSSSWTGLAWEIAPYVSVDRLVLGFRWAGLPRFGGSDFNSRINWTAGSFFAGIQF